MAVYAAVYVLPSWIENMLTAGDGCAHVWLPHEMLLMQMWNAQYQHIRVVFFFFLFFFYQHKQYQSQDCLSAELLCCKPWHVSTDHYIDQYLNWDGGRGWTGDECQHVQATCSSTSSLPPFCGSQISLIAYTPAPPTLHNLPPLPPARAGAAPRSAGPWESGLGWGPLTNTQPNVLIDPMPSYFRTSERRRGAARRDRQAAALKELEQEGGRRAGGRQGKWREGGRGAAVGSQHSTEEVNKEAGGTSSTVQHRLMGWGREGCRRMNECDKVWMDG